MDSVFQKKDYSSGDGMLTKIWGPSLWHVLHTMSFNYPIKPTTEQKHEYANFIYSLGDVLPCKYCRINLPNNMKKVPFKKSTLRSRESFSKWVYDLHNEVNKMLGKPTDLTYEEVRERYEHFRARCSAPTKKKAVKKQVGGVKETGCVVPLYGVKAKCVLRVVPEKDKCETFAVNPKCRKKRHF
tara:strand:+ start:514 stop:1065 length:552 start_codon:yes stop_codon:yes gene_type:complete